MMQLNDKFVLALYHGKATEKYMKELIKIFEEYGIKSEIKIPVHTIPNDTKTPVL